MCVKEIALSSRREGLVSFVVARCSLFDFEGRKEAVQGSKLVGAGLVVCVLLIYTQTIIVSSETRGGSL